MEILEILMQNLNMTLNYGSQELEGAVQNRTLKRYLSSCHIHV